MQINRGPLARLAAVTALAVTAGWLSATPAFAKASDKEINRAREACKDIAGNRNWKNVKTDVKSSNDDRVVMEVMGRRDGEDRTRECRYNLKKENAEFDDQ